MTGYNVVVRLPRGRRDDVERAMLRPASDAAGTWERPVLGFACFTGAEAVALRERAVALGCEAEITERLI